MATHPTDDTHPQTSTTVVKRKRRASCLDEQSRRERKRAIDRDAQRSLRSKNKAHIAELERTIQILRNQDGNGATASLLGEIETLRTENERLRSIIDGVKSVVNLNLDGSGSGNRNENGEVTEAVDTGKASRANGGQQSPKTRQQTHTRTSQSFEFSDHHGQALVPTTASQALDIDGMTTMPGLTASTNTILSGVPLTLHTLAELPETGSLLDIPESPHTAAFAPYMAEVFGHSWSCPSPTVLHIDSPSSSSSSSITICPIWTKANEMFCQVFSYRPNPTALNFDTLEAGLLYLGIKQGWSTFNEWRQSPALKILKEVDEFLFVRLPRMERLATAYKSFKLLKYYLNATKEELEKVPLWLHPSPAQARTKHPMAIDFFAWPTLRDRLVQKHMEIFQTQDLSHSYSSFLRFDWPFSFEDAFFFDEALQAYRPSPLFERYHRDLKYWCVADEFYERHPELMTDIEGDRRRFTEVSEQVGIQ